MDSNPARKRRVYHSINDGPLTDLNTANIKTVQTSNTFVWAYVVFLTVAVGALFIFPYLRAISNDTTDGTIRVFELDVTNSTIFNGSVLFNGTSATCSVPFDNNCIPPIPSSTVVCDALLSIGCIPPIPTTQLNGTITNAQLEGNITSAKLQCDTVLPVGCLGSGMGIDNSMCTTPITISCVPAIPTANLTGTILEAQIEDGAVTNTKLATDSVSTIKIQDGAVTNPKLATDAVSTIKVQDLAITNPKLAGGITSAKLACDAVLASGCLPPAKAAFSVIHRPAVAYPTAPPAPTLTFIDYHPVTTYVIPVTGNYFLEYEVNELEPFSGLIMIDTAIAINGVPDADLTHFQSELYPIIQVRTGFGVKPLVAGDVVNIMWQWDGTAPGAPPAMSLNARLAVFQL